MSLPKHFSDIPPYSGNEGATNEQPAEAHETVAVAKKAAVKVNAAPVAKVVQASRDGKSATLAPVETAVTTGRPAASMADFMNATAPQPAQVGFGQQQPQRLNTGFTPVTFNQPQQPAYAPVSFAPPQPQYGFATPSSPYAPAPVGLPTWMGGQPTHNPAPQNPFMRATPSSIAQGNGSTGLI